MTSPYGLHVGHYKAAIFCPSILEVDRILLLIPFKLGMVPERWRQMLKITMYKEDDTKVIWAIKLWD